MAGAGFSSLSLRTQLMVLAVLLTLPALGLIVYSGLKERAADYQRAVVESRRLADNLAAQQESLTNEARLLCSLLAGLPEVQSRDAARVKALLADIHRQTPQYLNILITDAAGYVWASAVPADPSISIAERRFFTNARRTLQFSSGEYVVGKFSLKPTISMAYPIVARGEFAGAVVVGFDLEGMRSILDRAQLSVDANYVFVDHAGIIVSRGVDAAPLLGKPIPPESLQDMAAGPDTGTFEFLRRDGDVRITTYRKLWLPGEQTPYMYVRAGISKKDVLAESNRTLAVNLSALLLFVVCSFLAVMVIGKRSIVDRITVLKQASQRLAGGDLDVRIAGRISGGELGSFAETFDSMAQQLGAREESLREVNRELEAFGYTLSHDLRSHLARLSLACETLRELDGERLGPEGRYCQETIVGTCQSMDALIAKMLTLAHTSRREMQIEAIDLSALARRICGELAQANPERILHFDIAPGLRAAGDAHLLQVALENLFGNACKYTRNRAEARISLSARQQGGRQVFAVADNGIGFDMSEGSQLFQAFRRLSSAREFPGFGIGLATVQRIIQRHGGEIWAEAVPGEGATFFFTLAEQDS